MAVESCEAVLRQHRQLLSRRNGTIQALATDRPTAVNLQ